MLAGWTFNDDSADQILCREFAYWMARRSQDRNDAKHQRKRKKRQRKERYKKKRKKEKRQRGHGTEESNDETNANESVRFPEERAFERKPRKRFEGAIDDGNSDMEMDCVVHDHTSSNDERGEQIERARGSPRNCVKCPKKKEKKESKMSDHSTRKELSPEKSTGAEAEPQTLSPFEQHFECLGRCIPHPLAIVRLLFCLKRMHVHSTG